MKTIRSLVWVVGAMIAALNIVAQSNAKASVVGMDKVKSGLQNLNALVLSTDASLQKVKEAEKGGDIKGAISQFSRDYGSLEAQAEQVREDVVRMKALSKAHHDQWTKDLESMQNPNLKKKASSRLEDVKGQFDKIIEAGDKAKRAFVPYVADLKDVKTFLDVDSSAEAVKSLSNSIWKLGNQSRSVSGEINNVIERIDKAIQKAP